MANARKRAADPQTPPKAPKRRRGTKAPTTPSEGFIAEELDDEQYTQATQKARGRLAPRRVAARTGLRQQTPGTPTPCERRPRGGSVGAAGAAGAGGRGQGRGPREVAAEVDAQIQKLGGERHITWAQWNPHIAPQVPEPQPLDGDIVYLHDPHGNTFGYRQGEQEPSEASFRWSQDPRTGAVVPADVKPNPNLNVSKMLAELGKIQFAESQGTTVGRTGARVSPTRQRVAVPGPEWAVSTWGAVPAGGIDQGLHSTGTSPTRPTRQRPRATATGQTSTGPEFGAPLTNELEGRRTYWDPVKSTVADSAKGDAVREEHPVPSQPAASTTTTKGTTQSPPPVATPSWIPRNSPVAPNYKAKAPGPKKPSPVAAPTPAPAPVPAQSPRAAQESLVSPRQIDGALSGKLDNLSNDELQQHLQEAWDRSLDGAEPTASNANYRHELREGLKRYFESLPIARQNAIQMLVMMKERQGFSRPGQEFVHSDERPYWIVANGENFPKSTPGAARRAATPLKTPPGPPGAITKTSPPRRGAISGNGPVFGREPSAGRGIQALPTGPNFHAPKLEPSLKSASAPYTPEKQRREKERLCLLEEHEEYEKKQSEKLQRALAMLPPLPSPVRTPPVSAARATTPAATSLPYPIVPRDNFENIADYWHHHAKLGRVMEEAALAQLSPEEVKAFRRDENFAKFSEAGSLTEIKPRETQNRRGFWTKPPRSSADEFTAYGLRKEVFQLASDIHMERESPNEYEFGLIKDPAAKFLVLAGDIGSLRSSHREQYKNWIKKQTDLYEFVFHVCGNNEFHHTGNTIKQDTKEFLSWKKDPRFKGRFMPLQKTHCSITTADGGKIEVIGCTLWSDLDISRRARLSRQGDFGAITGNTFESHRERYKDELEYIRQEVKKIRSKKDSEKTRILVITHHAPSRTKISRPQLDGGEVCSYYGSDILAGKDAIEGLGKGDIWVFGHTHLTTTWIKGGVEVHANQMRKKECKGYLNYTVSI